MICFPTNIILLKDTTLHKFSMLANNHNIIIIIVSKYAVYEISALYMHTYHYDVIVTLVCLIEHVATTIYIYYIYL